MDTGHKYVDELDALAFMDAATDTVTALLDRGYAVVDLIPGDATHYQIFVIATPERHDPYIVGLVGFGATYPWRPSHVSLRYAQEKWGGDGASHEWTGAVVCRFLNAVAAQLGPVRVAL